MIDAHLNDLRDALALCSYAARGFCVELLRIALASPRVGYIMHGTQVFGVNALARATGGTEDEVRALLIELHGCGVLSKDGDLMLIPKVVSREKRAAVYRNNGRNGGHRKHLKPATDLKSGYQSGYQTGNQSGNQNDKSGNQTGNQSGYQSGYQTGNQSGNQGTNTPTNTGVSDVSPTPSNPVIDSNIYNNINYNIYNTTAHAREGAASDEWFAGDVIKLDKAEFFKLADIGKMGEDEFFVYLKARDSWYAAQQQHVQRGWHRATIRDLNKNNQTHQRGE